METFSALLAICAGNSPVTGEFPTQRPVTWNFDVFFDLRHNKRWVNNGEAGDLSRHRAHYNVTVMSTTSKQQHLISIWISQVLLIFNIDLCEICNEALKQFLGTA